MDRATLTFTPANWNVPQTVTVTGVDDTLGDGEQIVAIGIAVDAAASDDAFDGRPRAANQRDGRRQRSAGLYPDAERRHDGGQ